MGAGFTGAVAAERIVSQLHKNVLLFDRADMLLVMPSKARMRTAF